MEYDGPAHYFFWKGVEKGRGSSIQGLPGWLDGMCPIDNKTSKDCREAFSWGFCWGLTTGEDDFKNPEPERKVIAPIVEDNMQEEVDEQSDDMYDDLEKDYPFRGEC